jgi:hypothetical protein
VAPTLAAPTAQQPNGGAVVQTLRPTLILNNSVATGEVGNVTYRFEISERADFPAAASLTVASGEIAQGAGGTTQWTPSVDLQADFLYFWRARATNGTITTAFSVTATTRTWIKGSFVGQTVFDPLTNNESVGRVLGGRFTPQGWEALSLNDAIDYDIPTMTSGVFEFDIIGVEEDEPGPYDIGHKFYCMGSSERWDFGGFRDGDWKASLDKKTGRLFRGESGVVEHIFRLQLDDNRTKTGERDWDETRYYHIRLQWGSGRVYTTIDNDVIADETYSGPYAPQNHRISLGCRPRNESLRFARYKNVRITPR